MALEVRLSQSDRVYHAGDQLLGEIVVDVARGSGPLHHSGLRVSATGSVQMRVSERAVGVFEAFFLNVRPVTLLNEAVDVAPPGRFEEGITRLPFALPLRPPAENPGIPLYETYHGINISVQYGVAAELERSLVRGGKLATGLVEFIMEERGTAREQQACDASPPLEFVLAPESQLRSDDGLRVTGRLEHGTVALQRPVTGWVTVEACSGVLRSLELTLGRVEWCTVAEGDVTRGLPLPIHVILPRLYTCPTVDAGSWGVHFELAITAQLEDDCDGGRAATCRLPLRLVRAPN